MAYETYARHLKSSTKIKDFSFFDEFVVAHGTKNRIYLSVMLPIGVLRLFQSHSN